MKPPSASWAMTSHEAVTIPQRPTCTGTHRLQRAMKHHHQPGSGRSRLCDPARTLNPAPHNEREKASEPLCGSPPPTSPPPARQAGHRHPTDYGGYAVTSAMSQLPQACSRCSRPLPMRLSRFAAQRPGGWRDLRAKGASGQEDPLIPSQERSASDLTGDL